MNIAIVDDRAEERDSLKALLLEYAAANSIEITLREFPCGEEFLMEYAPFTYTVIFLDIYMDGMETAEKIRETDTDTPVIFLTTSRELFTEPDRPPPPLPRHCIGKHCRNELP